MMKNNEKSLPLILTGKIVHGKGLGRTVGMPTANLQIDDECELPNHGVYATLITVRGQVYKSVTNIGRRPSVDQENYVTVEVFIVDFDEDIYGEDVILEVHKFLRPIQKFASLEAVKTQVEMDLLQVSSTFV